MVEVRILVIGVLFFCYSISEVYSQNQEKRTPFQFSGFLNLYYGYDFNEPNTEKRLPFLYNHTRHNRPFVNLALVSGTYQTDRFRANLGIHAGTYAEDNYANEPKFLQFIHQANFGFALDQEKTLWLDAGVLPSHIGFESAVSKDNLTLSRSLIAENSPYFETGVRLGWQANEKWYLSFLYLNGWQRIKPIPGKNNPSFGTQVSFALNSNTTLNWSTFLGTDSGIEAGTSIYFSNMYGIFSLGEKWKLIAGLDVGNRVNQMSANQTWWGTSLIAQFDFSENISSSIRYEYFHDPFQGISFSFYETGLEAGGISLNVDRKFGTWGVLRIEGRYLDSPNPFFQDISESKSDDFFVLGSFSVFWD